MLILCLSCSPSASVAALALVQGKPQGEVTRDKKLEQVLLMTMFCHAGPAFCSFCVLKAILLSLDCRSESQTRF